MSQSTPDHGVVNEKFLATYMAKGWTLAECQVEVCPDLDDNIVTVYDWHLNDENGNYAGVLTAVHATNKPVSWEFMPFTFVD